MMLVQLNLVLQPCPADRGLSGNRVPLCTAPRIPKVTNGVTEMTPSGSSVLIRDLMKLETTAEEL
jgi:hypothetical protein